MATFVGEWERYLHQVEGTDGFQVGRDTELLRVEFFETNNLRIHRIFI